MLSSQELCTSSVFLLALKHKYGVHVSLIPAVGKQRWVDFRVKGQPARVEVIDCFKA